MQPVIGIEVHVELGTESKMFCGCAVDFGAPPNTLTCPVCLGLPGALPVPNSKALEWIAAIGLALSCDVTARSVFHRKNYFYADLPKNYQISQFDVPICKDGWLDVEAGGETVRVGIERAHMEEDTGKSAHLGDGGRIHGASATLLDFNRSGVPLVEIVSRPDIHTAGVARAYAQELREVILALGVSDARLEEGSFRFDANVSVRPDGSDELGTKVEVKNMNSFRSLERAVAYEAARQEEVVAGGGEVIQETRHWDESQEVTLAMRTKEGSSDYRYFSEPDLVPVVLEDEWVDRVASRLPELPAQRRGRYRELGAEPGAAAALAGAPRGMQDVFEGAVEAGAPAQAAANWVTGQLAGWVRRTGTDDAEIPIEGSQLAALVAMIDDGRLSASAAKEVLEGVLGGEGEPEAVAEQRDLLQVSDESALREVVSRVVAANAEAVESYRSGAGDKVIGFLIGQVMRETGGRADPRVSRSLVREALDSAAG